MPSGPNRVLVVLVSVVALLAVAAALVVANRPTPVLDPDTPEGTVQAFLQAMFDEDYAAAADLLASSSACDATQIASYPGSARIVLDRVTSVDDDTAVVILEVTEGSEGDPFGGSGWSHTERITVKRESGVWKIAGTPWLLYCEERSPTP